MFFEMDKKKENSAYSEIVPLNNQKWKQFLTSAQTKHQMEEGTPSLHNFTNFTVSHTWNWIL